MDDVVKVHFVGAGPGAEDLITVRGMRLLNKADVVIFAGSLVNPELLKKGEELCSMTATGVRVQLIGTDRISDLQKEWKSFFTAAERLQISRKSFCKAIRNFATEFAKVYRRPFPENLSNPLKYKSLNIYVDEMFF